MEIFIRDIRYHFHFSAFLPYTIYFINKHEPTEEATSPMVPFGTQSYSMFQHFTFLPKTG